MIAGYYLLLFNNSLSEAKKYEYYKFDRNKKINIQYIMPYNFITY